MADYVLPSTIDGEKNWVTEAENWLDNLRNGFLQVGAPGTPVNGDRHTDNTVPSRPVMNRRVDGAWKLALYTHILEEDLDFDKKQAVRMLLEQLATGSLPTPGATEESRVCYDSTRKRGVVITDTEQRILADLVKGTHEKRVRCSLMATPADPGTAAVVDEIDTFLLNAATEELSVYARVPNGWSGDEDLKLAVQFLLNGAETNNDIILWDLQWITMGIASGEASDEGEESATQKSYDILTASGAKDYHEVEIVVDHDAVGNVIGAGDMWRGTFKTNVGSGDVAAINVIGADLIVPVLNYDD